MSSVVNSVNNYIRKEIVLIGPIGAGKSTVAGFLSSCLDLPVCSLDDCRWKYYYEIGYDDNTAQTIENNEGFCALYEYWKKFEIHAVERALQDHCSCIFDFGAGHSVYDNSRYLIRAKQALCNFPNTYLLLPSNDVSESLNILASRRGFVDKDLIEVNKHFLTHKSNQILANHIIYTENYSAEDVVNKIVSTLL